MVNRWVVSPLQKLVWTLALSLAAPAAALEPPAAERTRFLVFPLADLTSTPSLAWLGEGLAIALANQLEAAGFDAVDRDTRVGFADAAGLPRGTPLSRATMIRIAREVGADRLVFGSYSAAGESIRVTAGVLDVRGMKLGPEVVAAAPVKRLAEAENELAWQIASGSRPRGGETRETFRQRMRSVPNDAFSYYVRTLGLGDPNSRSKLLLRAIELYPGFPEALFLLGKDYYRRGDWSQAAETLEKVREDSRCYTEARFMLGTCQYLKGLFQDAVRSYSTVLGFGERVEVDNNLGAAYLRAGDLPQGVRHLSQAHALSRGDALVAMNLAVARQLEGDERASQRLLEGALRSNPDNGLLHYLLYQALKGQGLEHRALQALDDAIRAGIDPESVKNEDPRSWLQIHMTWSSAR